MDNQKPRVGIFMAAGIVAAIVIGFFVWNASSSERSAQAGYVSETTSEQPRKESPVSKTSRVTSDTRSEQVDDDAGQNPDAAPQQPQPQVNLAQPSTEGQGEAYSLNSDPYAPQHAVVGTAQQQASTRVFRPTNVVPTTVLPTTAAAMQGEGEAAETPSAAESSAPPTQETPGTPGEGSSTTTEPTPAEPKPADPAGEPAGEPAPEPPAGATPTPSGAPQSAEQGAQSAPPQESQAHTQVGPEVDQGAPPAPAPAPREAGTPQQGFSSEAQQAWNRWISNFRR